MLLPTVWVLESEVYANAVREALSTPWRVVACGASGALCDTSDNNNSTTVVAVVGRADAANLSALPALRLVQGTSYFYTDGASVPPHAAIATTTGFWPAMGMDQIAEWCIAAVFESLAEPAMT